MGRYLDMARDTKNLTVLPELSPMTSGETWPSFPLPAAPEPRRAEDDFDGPASDVLDILAKAAQPVSHSEIVKALVEKGHERINAKEAIARCQESVWIEHDLLKGYVLSA